VTPNQFLISTHHRSVDQGFADWSFAGLTIHVHEAQPAVRIVDEEGTQIGVLIGVVINYAAFRVEENTITFAPDDFDRDLRSSFEAFIAELGGSWTCVVCMGVTRAVYCDGTASLSCLFSPAEQVVATSASQILSSQNLRDARIQNPDGFFKGNTYFPAGLTAFSGIYRLLINFRLDLDTWEQQRVWQSGPNADLPAMSPSEIACFVASRVRSTIEILCDHGSVAVPLTAGNESRILLSATKNVKDKLLYYTIDYAWAAVDVARAKALAAAHNLNHQVLRPLQRTKDEVEVWRQRTSYSVGGMNGFYRPSTPNTRYSLTGSYGEVARGLIHYSKNAAEADISAAGLLTRLRVATTDRNIAAMNWWLSTLIDNSPIAVLDSAFLEIKYGCWSSTQAVSRETLTLQIAPLGERSVLSAMMSLPVDYRLRYGMTADAISANWPELLSQPINKAGWLATAKVFACKLADSDVVLRKLKKGWLKLSSGLAPAKPLKATSPAPVESTSLSGSR
jgi:hypothetical protein